VKAGEIVDSLQTVLDRALATLVAGNVTGIATELINADDGTLSVGFSLKLNLSGKRVAGTGALSYSRKFKDEVEFITPDPDQPPLPGMEVTQSGGGAISHEQAERVFRDASGAFGRTRQTGETDADGDKLTGGLKKAVRAIDKALESGATAKDVKDAIQAVQKSKGGAV
jgi:hypothetical protein